MRNFLYLTILAISLIGCATDRKVISLQKQMQEIRTDIIKLIDARDRHEDSMEQLIHRNAEIVAFELQTEKRSSQDAKISLSNRLVVLENFKDKHDKRWPPPVKLKKAVKSK